LPGAGAAGVDAGGVAPGAVAVAVFAAGVGVVMSAAPTLPPVGLVPLGDADAVAVDEAVAVPVARLHV
jgi:hypothetical protein